MLKKEKFTRCLRCNRILKTLYAQQRGYGDVCWKQHKKDVEVEGGLFKLDIIEEKK